MRFFKPKVDIEGVRLVIRDNNDRKVHLIQTQRKQKTGITIVRVLVPETD